MNKPQAKRSGTGLIIGWVAVFTLALSQIPVPSGPLSDTRAALIARGLEVYKAQYCGVCHQLKAVGAKGIMGPSHDAMGAVAAARVLDANYGGNAQDSEGYIRESILEPEVYRVPGYGFSHHHMPAYTSLSDDDLTALVAMLLEQTGAQP